MENDTCVQVAVRIRPQIPREIIDMCRICTRVTPGEPQITIGSNKSYTYDHVFDTIDQQEYIYEKCVSKLVEGSLQGYNATVLAYGQTGSGKTYTMGTGFDVELPEELVGIIPRAIQHIFNGIEKRLEDARLEYPHHPLPEFKIMAQFMEIYNEEIIDLFDPGKVYKEKQAMKIHEDSNGQIHIFGVQQKPVRCVDDALQCLRIGALSRRTASTQMNSQSSRSHAIFSLLITQQRVLPKDNSSDLVDYEVLTSKFHFVDLAGSERMKRTGATGDRAKEGISINCGLLALGNVISALSTKSKKSHIPYRDSKLTRLLQDSLGGNSQTLMIACISPSDRDFMETLNTLKYANRAKDIKNKVILNQDKSSRTISILRQEIAQLQIELLEYKQGKRVLGEDGQEHLNDMHLANKMMESELNLLRNRIKAMQETINVITVEKTELLTSKAKGSWISQGQDDISDVIQNYIQEIEELRIKLMESEFTCQNLRKQVSKLQANLSSQHSFSFLDDTSTSVLLEHAKYDLQQKMNILSRSSTREMSQSTTSQMDDDEDKDINDMSDSETESDEKSEQLGNELAELSQDIDMKQKLIEELELSQKRIQTLKKNYENQLLQLQAKINDTQAERDTVLNNLHSQSSEPEKVRTMKDKYEKRIVDLQQQLKQLQAAKKQHNKLLRDQSQHESQLKSLKNDLANMKRMKVKIINQMKEESARHKDAETRRIRQIAQLQKESRKNAKVIQNMEAENKQKDQVLKRKQEEVMALRRMQRERHLRRSLSSSTPTSSQSSPIFSPKLAKQKWYQMEKIINKIVVSKQVLAYQERDMNRLLVRRDELIRNLERLRHRKSIAIGSGQDYQEIDIEIDNDMEELNYIQDSLQESQQNIVQIEESKEHPDVSDVQQIAQSIHTMGEARYLIDKLLNLSLSQSYVASQRELLVQERDTELEQIKQDHQMVHQLLEYMLQQSDNAKSHNSLTTSFATTHDGASSCSSSRSVSPTPSTRVSLFELSGSSSGTSKNKARQRTAVSREVLLGMKTSSDDGSILHGGQPIEPHFTINT